MSVPEDVIMRQAKSWRLLVIILALSAALHAQTGGISGSVTDPSGAALQNVRITARNIGTNAVRVVASSDVGSYSITNLPPGAYEVTFESAGFKILSQSSEHLNAVCSKGSLLVHSPDEEHSSEQQ